MLTFLPFPSWYGLVGLVTSATVIMYAMAPLALTGLRRQDPDRPRAYRLPAAQVLSPLAFVLANIVVYVSGFSTLFWLMAIIIVGYIVFALVTVGQPREHRSILDWRAAWWILPWLGGLLIISWVGRYNASNVFGVTMQSLNKLGNWWDLLVVAAWSLIIFYAATFSAMSTDKVQAAVSEVQAEASIELESHVV